MAGITTVRIIPSDLPFTYQQLSETMCKIALDVIHTQYWDRLLSPEEKKLFFVGSAKTPEALSARLSNKILAKVAVCLRNVQSLPVADDRYSALARELVAAGSTVVLLSRDVNADPELHDSMQRIVRRAAESTFQALDSSPSRPPVKKRRWLTAVIRSALASVLWSFEDDSEMISFANPRTEPVVEKEEFKEFCKATVDEIYAEIGVADMALYQLLSPATRDRVTSLALSRGRKKCKEAEAVAAATAAKKAADRVANAQQAAAQHAPPPPMSYAQALEARKVEKAVVASANQASELSIAREVQRKAADLEVGPGAKVAVRLDTLNSAFDRVCVPLHWPDDLLNLVAAR